MLNTKNGASACDMQISRVAETMSGFVGELLQAIVRNALPILNNIEHLELPDEQI